MFNHEWFHGGGLQRLLDEARRRCTRVKHPEFDPARNGADDGREYFDALETRTIVYMKDGLQYEIREMADVGTSNALSFECVPVDENYRVGAIVIIAPYEDIARVEVFAVHPSDKPQETFKIPGFRAGATDGAHG